MAQDYSHDDLELVMAPLAKAAGRDNFDRTQVHTRLRDLLLATGQRYDDEFGREFNALGRPDDRAALAVAFGLIAAAEEADIVAVAEQQIERHPIIRTMLRAASGVAGRTPLRELPEAPALRRHAARLQDFQNAQFRRGAPRKNSLDALLVGLAEIFCSIAHPHSSPFDMPHTESARFVQFAYAALAPFCERTEVTAAALSHRWSALKKHERTG